MDIKKVVEKTVDLFTEVSSGNIRSLNETIFSKRLQNVWIETIEEIISAFGMRPLSLTARERATIDEIVEKRNTVAHGGESASFVGERQRAPILRVKLQIAQEFYD